MPGNNEDRFRVRPASPKSRGGPRSQRFVSQVLKQVSKSGAKPSGKGLGRPANTFGRGRVAASMAGQSLRPNARRMVVKSRFVVLSRASPNSVAVHLRYIERDGVTRDGQKGQAYAADNDAADLKAFQERGQNDRHQFRFIVSAEDGLELADLKGFTRQLMRRMEIDLETRLDWVAVDHWDTDNPHTHIVLNGHTGGSVSGRENLVIAPDYMAHGMRMRASEIATAYLGLRTDAEMRHSLIREVDQQRLTSLDRTLIRQADPQGIDFTNNSPTQNRQHQIVLRARLQRLEGMGLAKRVNANRWDLMPGMAATLDALGERENALEMARRAMKGQQREFVLHEWRTVRVTGRIAGKGLADELHDRYYLVVDGIDGRAHYLSLAPGTDLAALPINGILEASPSGQVKEIDRSVAAVARNGVYRAAEHLSRLIQANDLDPQSTVDVHVRRLEALRRVGIVARVAEGIWQIPTDMLRKAQHYDAQKSSGPAIVLRSHMPIERQVRALGATWLDRQLVGNASTLAGQGFGAEVRSAIQGRMDFLIEQDLAKRQGRKVIVARNLLSTLKDRELASVGKALQDQTGQSYRSVQELQQVSGVYLRSVQLVSGRYAILDDGKGFSLVPWKPMIEQRLGQTVTATIRGGAASWDFRRQRGPTIG